MRPAAWQDPTPRLRLTPEAAELLAALHARPDLPCRDLPTDLFYPPEGRGERGYAARVLDAKDVCAGCPARVLCLDYAMTAGEAYGIWGGLTPAERRALRTTQTRRP